MRALVVSAIAGAVACQSREPPAGSGDPERPLRVPISLTDAAARPPSGYTSTACPNGAVVVHNAMACTFSLVAQDGVRWTHVVPACNHVLEIAVAPDSTIYARTERVLHAFGNDGNEMWKMALPDVVPTSILRPATTLGSLVVVATSPGSLAAFSSKGVQEWTMRLPSDEEITEAPASSLTEGVTLVTPAATYFVGGNGVMRSRHPHAPVR